MRAWVYSASMNTSELQAVMTISPPRFSRTVLFNVLLLSRGEWLRGKIGVGGVINLKKKLSFAKISVSSGASQAGLWMKTSQFDIFSFYQTCFPCPCIVTLCQTLWVELARHTVPRVSVGMLNPSTPYICQPQRLQIFQRWAQLIWWRKVHGKFCTCAVLSRATINLLHW